VNRVEVGAQLQTASWPVELVVDTELRLNLKAGFPHSFLSSIAVAVCISASIVQSN
jgi:hypothetical protein